MLLLVSGVSALKVSPQPFDRLPDRLELGEELVEDGDHIRPLSRAVSTAISPATKIPCANISIISGIDDDPQTEYSERPRIRGPHHYSDKAHPGKRCIHGLHCVLLIHCTRHSLTASERVAPVWLLSSERSEALRGWCVITTPLPERMDK